MKILAIDPGPTESAWVFYDDEPIEFKKQPNAELLEWLETSELLRGPDVKIVIEMIASYGMPVGAEVFETCVWIGRFTQAVGAERVQRIFRVQVKMALCGNTRARDSNIRQALIDRYGPGPEKAIGTKRDPGPLYGVAGDVWAALGVAVTFEAEERLRSRVSLK